MVSPMFSNYNRIFRILSFIFTGLNGLAGILGIYFVFIGDVLWPLKLIIIGSGFDFLDGYFAKKSQKYSRIGAYSDCIADTITYVVLPTFVILSMSQLTQREYVRIDLSILLIGLLYLLCGNYRLIRFIKDPTVEFFEGLPASIAALIVGSLNVLINIPPAELKFLFSNGIHSSIFMLCISFLMITHLKYPSHISYSQFFKILRLIGYLIIGLFVIVSNFWTGLGVFLIFLLYTLAGPYFMRTMEFNP
jgi:phosphatidylserine synthase